jgi:hypothetical protein
MTFKNTQDQDLHIQRLVDARQEARKTLRDLTRMSSAIQREALFLALSDLLDAVESLPPNRLPAPAQEASEAQPGDAAALIAQVELELAKQSASSAKPRG